MNQIVYIPCTIIDFPKVLPILEAFSDVFDYQGKRQVVQTAQKILDEDPQHPTVYLAKHEGSIIGFVGLQRQIDDPSQLELFGHVVKRGYQGQGVGTRLLDHAVNSLAAHGSATQVIVTIKPTYPPSTRHFYQNRGFKPHFDESYRGASVEDVVMVKSVQGLPKIDSKLPHTS